MFKQRSVRPNALDKFYIKTSSGGYSHCVVGKPIDSKCDVLPNSVGYACGRFNEVYSELTGYIGMKYPYLNCNAEDFIYRAKELYKDLKINKTPRPGDIIVWQKGKSNDPSDGVGHVAFVERVNNDGTLLISESLYGSCAWRSDIINNKNKRWGMPEGYEFKGFIHNPAVTDEMIEEYNKNHEKIKYAGQLPSGLISKNVGTEDQIKMWQKYLNWYGGFKLQIDGIFDTKTINATKVFQQENNLDVCDFVDSTALSIARRIEK